MQIVTFERTSKDAAGDSTHSDRVPTSMGNAALGFESLDAHRPGARRLGAIIPGGPQEGSVVDLNRALAV